MSEAAEPTDQDLLRRAQEGDQRAFRALVERYEGVVAATVIGMMGRGADADDVGQETFIRLFRSLHRFRGESSLKTYVTRIAINQSLKALKKRQRWHARFFSADEQEGEAVMARVQAQDELSAREREAMIHKALQILTPEHRSVVVLRMLEEYDTRETAEILGIPQGTVMSRLARALEKLERVLGPML